ncbi:c-type cytochrome [Fulvivirga sp. M361]|uniref:cbb3-type cytochrome c oxidase N-terminal domain-containing protein n=1 Tax=Fulvivirga sp. M361 TaxID=2594266 RepID=UPI00117A8B4E|nr:cbb3-type cytochrome c oxidase N-terminal domain-containing protein [Fulvivirga sp. M361]TRX52664.1 c-type cytochrome [Fulvivirga sp. M361]
MKSILYKALVSLTFIFAVTGVQAQGTQAAGLSVESQTVFYIVTGFVFVIALLVLAVSVVVLQLLKTFVRQQAEQLAAERGETLVEEPGLWQQLWNKLNDFRPMEEEGDIVLDHNYDGIRELDNHLPPWWKWLFYVTIIFAGVYLAVYHVFDTMPLQEEEYMAQMEEAEAQAQLRMANLPESNVDENTVVMVEDATLLSKGKQVFNNNCAQCHKETGAGGIGPNLTDDYWLHGGSIQDIFRTVKVGVPEKGMISWEPLLSPDQMQNVSSYIITLRGTNPPNAKAPQGELYVPEAPKEEVVETDTLETIAALEGI